MSLLMDVPAETQAKLKSVDSQQAAMEPVEENGLRVEALSAPVTVNAEEAPHSEAETDQARLPIVIFEWELTPEERASDPESEPTGEAAEEEAESPLRWFGSIEAHLGYAPGEFPHTFEAWFEAIHPDDRERILNAIEHHLESGEPYFEECRARRQDGSWLHFVHSGVATRDSSGNPWKFTGTLSNFEVPGRKAAASAAPIEAKPAEAPVTVSSPIAAPTQLQQTQLQQEKARAESLLRTAAHLNAQLDLQDVCEAICEEAGRTIGAPSAVMLFNKSRDAFVPAAVRDMPRDYDKRYIPTPRSIYEGHVAAMGTLFLFTDAQATPDLPNHQLYREVDMRTIGIASLIREGEVLGLLKVYSFGESRTFDENELALLQGLADQGAQAISNARFYSESQRRLANIQSLRQIDMAILASNDVDVSLNVVLDQTVSRLRADAASVLLLNPHTRTLRYAAGRGFRTTTSRRTDWNMGEGLAGRAALERRLIYVPDLSRPEEVISNTDSEQTPLSNPILEAIRAAEANDKPTRRSGIPANEGFLSYYAVPLVAAGQVNGVLELWHRSPLPLDDEELEFLETLAGQAALAVNNALLFRDVQHSHDELMLAYDSTLEGWSGALDLRDKETEGHSQRVTSETLRLAAHMEMGDEELMHIRRGALLHDIGKMGIPDSILLKPGSLSDEEWGIMKKHPTYALELLFPITYLRPALDIPYSHHECWDGNGYPLGLSGRQIPLAARIFAVVDVWDALCSDRPYRKGWPLQRVLKHISEGAGIHFDPEVVKAFLELHPLIEGDEHKEKELRREELNQRVVTAALVTVPGVNPISVPSRRATDSQVIAPNLSTPIVLPPQKKKGLLGILKGWLRAGKSR